jgi:DNA repair exonuclease SbcCD nuclease subunit
VKLHPLAKVFGSDLEEVLLEDLGVRVAGKSYGERADTENPAPTYTLEPRPGLFSVGVLHATAGGSAGHSPYAPCSVAELAATGLDYVALGHIHTHAILHRDPWIVYPGCLQGRHINEAGPKGCCIVEVGSSGTGVRFEALDTVRWQRLAVEAANLKDQGALREALVSAVEESLETAEGRSLCLRLRIEGRTPLDGELRTRGTLDEHLAALRTEFADAEPFAWVERIDVSTRPPADLEARARQTDLLGLALQAAREAMDAEELPDGAVEALTPMFEKLQDAGAEPLADDELRAALGDARLLCLDLLDRERPG